MAGTVLVWVVRPYACDPVRCKDHCCYCDKSVTLLKNHLAFMDIGRRTSLSVKSQTLPCQGMPIGRAKLCMQQCQLQGSSLIAETSTRLANNTQITLRRRPALLLASSCLEVEVVCGVVDMCVIHQALQGCVDLPLVELARQCIVDLRARATTSSHQVTEQRITTTRHLLLKACRGTQCACSCNL